MFFRSSNSFRLSCFLNPTRRGDNQNSPQLMHYSMHPERRCSLHSNVSLCAVSFVRFLRQTMASKYCHPEAVWKKHVITCLNDLVLEKHQRNSFAIASKIAEPSEETLYRTKKSFKWLRDWMSSVAGGARRKKLILRSPESMKPARMATKKNSLHFIEQKHERFWLTVRYGEATQWHSVHWPWFAFNLISHCGEQRQGEWMDANVGDLKAIVGAAMFIDTKVY